MLSLQLLGSSDVVQVRGEGELPGKVNYLIGNDPKAWHTNVTTFSKVRYEEVYPGIDLLYYGNQQRLEYDFIVAPGADPNAIRMQIEGARKLQVAREGGLLVHLSDGEIRWDRPRVYQMDGDRHVPVEGNFVLAENRVGFHVGEYDHSRPLIIDPVLVYSTYIGPVTNQKIGVAVDPSGNFYLGTTALVTSPYSASAGSVPAGIAAGVDSGFVTKLAPDGTLVYSTYVGNPTNTNVNAIAVDAAGDAYITGVTDNLFPVTDTSSCVLQATNPPSCVSTPAFLAELNPQGNGIVYGTYLGGGSVGGTSSYGYGVAVDTSGNIFVAGSTTDPLFLPVHAYQPTLGDAPYPGCYATCGDFFVTKLGIQSGKARPILYSTYFGGSFQDTPETNGNMITTDGAGKVFVVGYTASTNFPTTANAYKTYCGTDPNNPCNGATGIQNRNDAVFFELDTNQVGATSLVYSTYIGGSGPDSASSVAVDSAGKVYVAGFTQSPADFPTKNSLVSGCNTVNENPFLMKFDTSLSQGNSLLWSTCLGFNGAGYGLALDSAGNPIVSADTNDGIFPPSAFVNAIQSDTGGLYLGKLSSDGTTLLWGTRFGGSTIQGFNTGIAVDPSDNVYLGGVTTYFNASSDLPTTLGSFSPDCLIGTNPTGCGVSTAGAAALFAAKIGPGSGTFPVATPRSLTFGALSPGTTSASQNFVFRNIGDMALTINSISISGANSGEFSITSAGCTTGVLAAGASCTDTVAFTPQTSGNKQATLVIDPPAVLENVALAGIGTPTVAPVATNESVSTPLNTAVNIILQATDSAGFALSYSIVTPPANGTLGAISGANVTYTPNAGFTGSDSFTYKANDGFLDSNTATVSITVGNTATTTTASSSLNPSTFGQSVTFAATVTSTAGTPTGTVTFLDGTNSLGSATLTGGVASLTTNTLTAGSHSITASYAGATGFAASTSSALPQTVNKAAPALTWPTPGAITYGTGLSASQLNATANVPGAFAYMPAAGTVLGAGTQSLSLTFTPTDSTDYATATASVLLIVNKATATVGLSSSANPSAVGQSVTFTATIGAQLGGAATGTVTFTDGATVLGTAAVIGNSTALSTSTLAAGTHSIAASYSGDANVLAATSVALSQVVSSSSITTTTTLASSPNPAYVTQTVTYMATVAAASGVPTGSVTFRQGTASVATVALVGGQANFTTVYTTGGARYITAVYGGSAPFLPSTSAVLREGVRELPAATTTVVSSSSSPSFVGQPVTLTATVTSTFGPIPSGESVTFTDGDGLVLGTATLSGGAASLSIFTLPAGSHPIRASYPGDSTFAASTSSAITQIVNKYSNSTTLTSSLNPSTYGQSVTLTATVITTGPATPTGNVTFRNGATTLATESLNASGVATLTRSNLPAGTLSFTATYNGDTQSGKSSASMTQTVNQASSTTSLTSSANPSTFGQSVTFRSTVITNTGITATGTVTFTSGTTTLGTVTLVGGRASFSTAALPRGANPITATYAGTANIVGSSASLSQQVN